MESNFLPVVIICLTFLLVGALSGAEFGATVGKHTYSSEVIDKMIEVCHTNNEIEKFDSRNRIITVHCKNGAHFIITAK